MGTGPAPFSDIGRRAKELLTKDYNYDQKFILTTLSRNGLGLTATGVKRDKIFVGDLRMQHRSGKMAFDVKIDTNSNISASIFANGFVSGARTSLNFKIPDRKSGKLDMQYIHEHAAVTSSFDLTPNPLLELSVAIGTRELSIGGEVGFDSASAFFTKYNAGIGCNKCDFSAALILSDKGETLKFSYIHVVNPINGAAVAAELVHRLNTHQNSFSIGSSHALDHFTLLKTRFSNNGKIAVLCQREWRSNSHIRLSAEYDSKPRRSSPARVGLSLVLKP